ncbi:MAG: hypothetical protein U9R43_18440, partial [Thermodesulfobacteriota bacterium]|nr:hypothetical protein [Thermodesulfobacteriota bacterium]
SDSGHFKEAIDVLETKGSENKEYTYKNISKNMAIQSSIADSYNWAIKESIASHSCYIFFGIMDYMYSDI